MTETKGRVHTDRSLIDYTVFPADGYALPRKMTARAELSRGLTVVVDIVMIEGRARAQKVTVSASDPRGIEWTPFAKLPLRDIVATAVLDSLMKVEPGDEGAFQFMPARNSETVREIVQAAVGYRPDLDRFRRVS
jgi:hypothetical protein